MKRLGFLAIMLFAIQSMHAQWAPITGPNLESQNVGMYMSQIVKDGSIFYSVIESSVHISYNMGESWMYASGTENILADKIAVIDSVIYVGSQSKGIYKSDNFGSSYIHINNGLPDLMGVSALLVTDSVLVAAIHTSNLVSMRNVYISRDKGNSWQESVGLSDEIIVSLASDGNNLYAGTNSSGVFMSTDNGENWQNIGLNNCTIASVTAKNNRIFAGESNSAGKLYTTTDFGANWNQVEGNGLNTVWFSHLSSADNLFYVGSYFDGVFVSNDNGVSWRKIYSVSNNNFLQSMSSSGNYVFIGFSKGFVYSADTGSYWHQKINTYNLKIRSITISGSNLMATTNQGVNTTSDEGLNWDRNLINMKIFETNDSIVYVGGDNGFYNSTDYGNTLEWYSIRGLPDYPHFTDIAAKGTEAFASLYNLGIYYSNDTGFTWTERNTGLLDYKMTSVTIADSAIFAGSDSTGIVRSKDNGLNWTNANTGIVDKHITCLANYFDNIYAGTFSNGLYKSVDNGNNWTHILNEFSESNVLCIYTYGCNIFVGVEGKGIYLSNNNGVDWVAYNEGLFDFNINSVAINDEFIYVGSSGGAIWKRAQNEFPLTFSFQYTKLSEDTICEGDTAKLSGKAIGGLPPYTYKWSNGSESNSIQVNPSGSSTYKLNVVDANSDTISSEFRVVVNPIPPTPSLSMNDDTLYSSSNIGNIWLIDHYVLWGAEGNTYYPHYGGLYTVKVNINGCLSKESNYLLIENQRFSVERKLFVYPNPAHETLIIEYPDISGMTVIRVLNAKGQEVLSRGINENKIEIDIRNYPEGIYFVKITNSGMDTIKEILIK